MKNLIITFNGNCRDHLAEIGTIVFEDATFLKNFIILETSFSKEQVRAMDGVTKVEEERTFSVFL